MALGGSWTAVNTGLTNMYVGALAIDPHTPSTLYAGTGGGVFDIELPCVVGTGTSDSCTEAALDACLPGGAGFTGAVTFNCGASRVAITVTSTKTISADTTIDGGSVITISGGNRVGVFSVTAGVNFAVQNLTIANGTSTNGGGAIYSNHGALTVTDSTLSGNYAGTNSSGGGIYSDGGPVTIINSTLLNNHAGTNGSGGGIYNRGGPLTVTNSTFYLNFAYNSGSGGGISNDYGGTLTVTNSTFNDNNASDGDGGAISNGNGGTLTITNSTFSGNIAGENGGTISNGNGGTLTITNSTFSNNYALAYHSNRGGAIYTNEAGTLVTNTIVANSSPPLDNCAGRVIDGGHNVDDGTSCGFSTANGSLSNTGPKLDSLWNNGGPTQTIALQAGSRAINAGDESVCATAPVNGIGQRGFVRPGVGAVNCSIGAYEFDSPGPPSGCVGDCNGDGTVTVDEIVTMVNIALGNAPVGDCLPGDANNDGQITVDEILTAVNNALGNAPVGDCLRGHAK